MLTPPSNFIQTGLLVLGSLAFACSSGSSLEGSGGANSSLGGASATGGGSGVATSTVTGGASSIPSTTSSSPSSGGASSGGMGQGGSSVVAAGGAVATGGKSASGVGGAQTGGTSTGKATGGQIAITTGGSSATGGITGAGGNSSPGGSTAKSTGGATGGVTSGTASTGGTTAGGSTNGGCVPTKTWGTVDPTVAGPFQIVVENNVGPENGNPDAKWNNQKPHFNLYYPKDMSQGYCHPIITWGNGTGDQPPTYEVLIKQLASHGFVVVASLSSQTAAGTPLPQVAGIDWMFKENADPASKFYHKLDTSKVGATGHSQGGMATSLTGADPRVVATVPICGARAGTLHGPSLLICGGADTMVPCSSVQTAFNGITGVPVMQAEMAGTTPRLRFVPARDSRRPQTPAPKGASSEIRYPLRWL